MDGGLGVWAKGQLGALSTGGPWLFLVLKTCQGHQSRHICHGDILSHIAWVILKNKLFVKKIKTVLEHELLEGASEKWL